LKKRALLILFTLTLVVSMVALSACGGEEEPTPTTPTPPTPSPTPAPTPTGEEINFRFLISDDVNAIDDFATVNVTISKIGVKRGGESGNWLEFTPDITEVDLKPLAGENALEIWNGNLTPGEYSKVFIYVSEVNGILLPTLGGETSNVKLPSEKLQISKPFTISEDTVTSFIYDVTVVNDGQSGQYVLQPQIGQSGADQEFKEVKPEEVKGEKPEKPSKPEPTPTAAAIPHTLDERPECLMCHASGALAVPDDHSGRANDTCTTCHQAPEEEVEKAPSEESEMKITSTAFQAGETIPTRYSCDGQDISPALSWSGAPEGTRSFALILDDPDAPGGTFTHWVIFNIPAETLELEEAIPTSPQLPNGALQGRNNFGTIGYSGPCPPKGSLHHYHFVIYALDETLDLTAGASKAQVLNAMQGHILAQAEVIGTYQR
jgi:hypothetical protein